MGGSKGLIGSIGLIGFIILMELFIGLIGLMVFGLWITGGKNLFLFCCSRSWTTFFIVASTLDVSGIGFIPRVFLSLALIGWVLVYILLLVSVFGGYPFGVL